MDLYRETAATWDKLAQAYENIFMDLEIYNDTYNVLCSCIQHPDGQVLDIGCGPGNISKYLLQKLPDVTITSIDMAPNMIALAQKNIPKGRFLVMNALDIDQLQQRFDAIICGFCIPYLKPEDIELLFTKCKSLLNSKGVLYLSYVEGPTEDSGYQTGSTGDSIYFHYYPSEQIASALVASGLSVYKTYQIPYQTPDKPLSIHTVIIAR